MHVAAQTMSRMASRWPAYLMVAVGLAAAALVMVVSPTLAQDTAGAAAAQPVDLKYLGSGLAAIAIIGPGIGIGILAGMGASAIGRNPDAAGQIRGLAVLMAAFAEGLGVIALVVALVMLFV